MFLTEIDGLYEKRRELHGLCKQKTAFFRDEQNGEIQLKTKGSGKTRRSPDIKNCSRKTQVKGNANEWLSNQKSVPIMSDRP